MALDFADLIPEDKAAPSVDASPAPPPAKATTSPISFDDLTFDDLVPAQRQSWPAAIGNAAAQGAIGGVGSAVSGVGGIGAALENTAATKLLAAADAVAEGQMTPQAAMKTLTPVQQTMFADWVRGTPEERVEWRAEMGKMLTAAPNAMETAGEGVQHYGESFKVDPAKEGWTTGGVKMAAGIVPMVAGAAAAGVAGGPVAGGMVIGSTIFGQSYDMALREARAKGLPPEQADQAAIQNAVAQTAIMGVPMARLLANVPAPMRDGVAKTLFNLGKHGVEFGSANALSRFVQNYILRESGKPDQPLTEGVMDAAAEGTIAGLIVPGGGALVRGVARRAADALAPNASPGFRRAMADIEALAPEAERRSDEPPATVEPGEGPQPPPRGMPTTATNDLLRAQIPEAEAPAAAPKPSSEPAQASTEAPVPSTDVPAARLRTIQQIMDQDGVGAKKAQEIQNAEIEAMGRPVTDEEVAARKAGIPTMVVRPEPEIAPEAEAAPRTVTPEDAIPEAHPGEDVGLAPAPDVPVVDAPVQPPGDAVAPPVDRPPAKPMDAVSFLILHGGIKDPGGDLAAMGGDAYHHRQAGRLVNNTRGLEPDKARELLADHGYLSHDTDISDLQSLVYDHLAGRPKYPDHFEAERQQWEQGRAAQREHDRATETLGDVVATAEQMGIRLSAAEQEHAARLILAGDPPEHAIEEAVRVGDREAIEAYNQARGMLSAREKALADRAGADAPSPEAAETRRRLATVMQSVMRYAGLPSSVGLRLVDRLVDAQGNAADAAYYRGLITFALDTASVRGPGAVPAKLFHEVVHGLMDPSLGILTPKQRQALLTAADRWLAQGDNRASLERMGYDPQQMREEAVARYAEEMLARSRDPGSIAQRAAETMARAAQAIGNGLRGQGFRSADGVLRAIMQGKVGAEESGAPRISPPSPADPQESRRDDFTLKDVLSRGAPKNDEALPREIREFSREHVSRLMGDVPVRFVPDGSLPPNAAGSFDINTRTIRIAQSLLDRPGAVQRVALHEGLHAATIDRLRADRSLVMTGGGMRGGIDRIADEVRAFVGGRSVGEFGVGRSADRPVREMYGLTNAEEFIAEAWSNPEFQKVLSQVPISKELARYLGIAAWRKVTLWDGFVQAVRKLLGLPRSTTSALEGTIRVTEALFHSVDPVAKAAYEANWHASRKAVKTQFSRRPPQPPATGPDLFGVEPPGSRERKEPEPTIKTDPRQQSMFGGPSAVQSQAARDQTGRGALTGKGPQRQADEGLFAPKEPDQDRLFSKREEGPPKTAANALARLGRLPVIAKAATTVAEHASDLASVVRMAVAPMAEGSKETMAQAKDFANLIRLARHETATLTEWLNKAFTPEERRQMWMAADEQSVLMQQGLPTEGVGLDRLSPDQRAAVERLQAMSDDAFEQARAVGMIDSEGLPSYVPRMVVEMVDGVAKPVSERKARNLPGSMENLRTNSPHLRHREHLTTEETERAARAALDNPNVEVVRDISTLPIATMKLQQAVAGRTLIQAIRKAGRQAGEQTVAEGAAPDDGFKWFTINENPAFWTWRVKAAEDGTRIMEKVPLFVRSDFEGPLRAVLTRRTGGENEAGRIYDGMMGVKGRIMTGIMWGLVHATVIAGRIFPKAPNLVRLYREGDVARNDPETMRRFLQAGGVPIGHNFGYQDISGAINSDVPSNRYLSTVAARWIAGDKAAATVEKVNDFVHNTLTWDTIGKWQMGMFNQIERGEIARGMDPQAAAKVAAHISNRLAGAMPAEAMSAFAQKAANLLMFSRSYRLGGAGQIKDVLNGLPRDVRAQIERDQGPEASLNAQQRGKRLARAVLISDLGIYVLSNSLLQSGANMLLNGATLDDEAKGYLRRAMEQGSELLHKPWNALNPFWILDIPEKLMSTAENEPGKHARILVGRQEDGTGIYIRNPAGKFPEDIFDYIQRPVQTLNRITSPFVKLGLGIFGNNRGFGRPIYDPYNGLDRSFLSNAWDVAKYIGEGVTPYSSLIEPVVSLGRRAVGQPVGGSAAMDVGKLLGSAVGVTISKGFPGGPEKGEIFAASKASDYEKAKAMPAIREAIRAGNMEEARQMMSDLHMPKQDQDRTVRSTLNPSRITAGQTRRLNQIAPPEIVERVDRARDRARP